MNLFNYMRIKSQNNRNQNEEIVKTYFVVKSAGLRNLCFPFVLELFRFSSWHAEVLSPQCYAIYPKNNNEGPVFYLAAPLSFIKASNLCEAGAGRALLACCSPTFFFSFSKIKSSSTMWLKHLISSVNLFITLSILPINIFFCTKQTNTVCVLIIFYDLFLCIGLYLAGSW